MLRVATRRDVWPFLVYGVLSTLCYALSFVATGTKGAYILGAVLWLFGPPAMLVHGSRLFTVYLIETAVIGALTSVGVLVGRQSWGGAVAISAIAVLAWLLCGFLAYTPAM
jgi:hypothetical protein